MGDRLQEPKLGVIDFLKLIHNGHPEYSLMAVKAPLEQTVKAFIEICKAQKTRERMNYTTCRSKEIKIVSKEIQWEKNLSLRSADESDSIPWVIAFIQVFDNEWTVILRSLFDLGEDEINDVPREAKELSVIFQTKTITLWEEDTSGEIYYEFFENGELLEKFVHVYEFYFESKLREKPDINFNWHPWEDEDYDLDQEYDVSAKPRVQFINDFFTELGIYLPACYPVTDEKKPTLAVEKSSENRIERADWLAITEILEKEQPKELDPDDAE